MTKAQAVEKVKELGGYSYYINNASFMLIQKLILATEENDPDLTCKYLTPNILEQIISLLVDCYDTEDFVKWCFKNDFNVLNNYRYACFHYYEDLSEEEVEDYKNGNCLFYSEEDKIIVESW